MNEDKKDSRLFTKSNLIGFGVGLIPIVLIIVIFWYMSWGIAWNIEYGTFVCAEVHPERVLNVTWILLEDGELMYGTYNPEVLDEIKPLISQLMKISEDQHSYRWLASVTFLQAKLAYK